MKKTSGLSLVPSFPVLLPLPVPAHGALERLLSRVHDDVVQQRLSRRELLLAHRADEELFPRVEALVLGEVALPLEAAAALLAFVRRCLLALFLEIIDSNSAPVV